MNRLNTKLYKGILFLILATLIITACITTIPVQQQRPPRLNTAGINRIAVMDFKATASGSYEITQYITAQARTRFGQIPQFTLVSHTQIEQLQRSGQSIDSYVDALFTGEVISVNSSRKSEHKSSTNSKGEVSNWTEYTTEVEVQFNYYFTRTRDGSMIGPVSRTARDRRMSREGYIQEMSLMQDAVNSQLASLNSDFAPHYVWINRTLEKTKSNNKDVKNMMKDAERLAKERSYRLALDMYLNIWTTHNDVAAAINAGILYEAMGEYVAGRNFMQSVHTISGNPLALQKLNEFNRIITDLQIIATDYSTTSNRRQQVVAHAINELQRNLPKNAKLWIHNNSENDPIVEAVVDDITADFLRKGIEIADRQHANLIARERRFQMSGMVSDNDFVTIGNAMGVNTIVIIGISGTGNLRRLSIKVLGVERSAPIFLSDTSEVWSI